jgi:hypothetical protein
MLKIRNLSNKRYFRILRNSQYAAINHEFIFDSHSKTIFLAHDKPEDRLLLIKAFVYHLLKNKYPKH